MGKLGNLVNFTVLKYRIYVFLFKYYKTKSTICVAKIVAHRSTVKSHKS